ncbi:hypothetical protein [Erythrobacter phage vB_EliS-L02]|nr:hypothetical protein [Erythrobacter phage vB_EliS-L02]
MQNLINIGLHSNRGGIIPVTRALSQIRRLGGRVVRYTVAESDSEPTLVAELSDGLAGDALEALSETLEQDCVAYVDSLGGALYGPKAADWGPFNPAYFLTMSGERLAALA